jgi:carbon monoxide dehydrogenase subunit G
MLGSLFQKLWGPVVVEDRMPAAPEEVYAVLADPETYPDWLVGAERIRGVDSDFPRRGSKFEHSVGPTKGATIDDRTESLGAQPNRHLTLLVHAGLFHGRVDFHLEPAGAGGTKIRFSEQPVGPLAVLTPLLRPSFHGRNKRSLQQLRDRLEVGTPE